MSKKTNIKKRRSYVLGIRLSSKEREFVERQADESYLSVSEWSRRELLKFYNYERKTIK